MSIIWFNDQNKVGVATLYNNNITLNKVCCTYLDDTYSVMLGLDYSNKKVIIRPLNKEQATRGDINVGNQYKITIRPSYSRISNTEFIKEIQKVIGESDLKTIPRKFSTSFNTSEHFMEIDLDMEVN